MYRGLQEAKNARVLYVDMNAFFASIEQQRDPRLRDRPMAVASHLSKNGTVLASSYEAKALGITTGTKIRDALQIFPELRVVETDGPAYQAVHRVFVQILHDVFGPEVIVRSIDEAALILAPNWQTSAKAHEMARAIKDAIHVRLGQYIRCSIGIAPNMLLAKLATDLQKPDGLVEITLENLTGVLGNISLTDLPGIAEASALNLFRQGIKTPLDLYYTPADTLKRQFGIWGQYWWWRLHGYEPDGFSGEQRSLSHQHVLKHWATDRKEVAAVIDKMADRLIHRLRKNRLACRWLNLRLSLVGLPAAEYDHAFDAPADAYGTLLSVIQDFHHRLPPTLPAAVRKITITFASLSDREGGLQLDLFQERSLEEQVSKAIQSIRTRYGFQAVQLGSVTGLAKGTVKEQPGFGKIRDRSERAAL